MNRYRGFVACLSALNVLLWRTQHKSCHKCKTLQKRYMQNNICKFIISTCDQCTNIQHCPVQKFSMPCVLKIMHCTLPQLLLSKGGELKIPSPLAKRVNYAKLIIATRQKWTIIVLLLRTISQNIPAIRRKFLKICLEYFR